MNVGGGLANWNSSKYVGRNVVNGDVMILSTWFGAYPCIGCGGPSQAHWCNGGIPQLANLTIHKETMKRDLAAIHAPSNWSGWVVNDLTMKLKQHLHQTKVRGGVTSPSLLGMSGRK